MVEKRFNRLELRELLENKIGTIVEPSRLEELENSLGGFDGFTFALKTGGFEQKITRRNFAKLSGFMLAILTGLPAILQSCATIGAIKEEGPIHYPKLPGKKIQAPEEGCYTGIWAGSGARWQIENYEAKVGKKPTFLFVKYKNETSITHGIFKMDDIRQCAEMDVIPFITLDARDLLNERRSILEDVYNSVYDNELKETAQKMKKFGDKMLEKGYNPSFFIRTMREMNMKEKSPSGWPPWGGSPKKFKKAWKHIWNIFENEGANEYATWVWNPYVGYNRHHGHSSTGEKYYPGEKYVDWIGLNAFSWKGYDWGTGASLYQLCKRGYSIFRKKHPDKPIMIANTSTPEGRHKPKWVLNAFESTKNNFPGIKALCWWSELWSHLNVRNHDSRIDSSPEALQAFKKGISDPYFLGKIPYRNH